MQFQRNAISKSTKPMHNIHKQFLQSPINTGEVSYFLNELSLGGPCSINY